MLRRLFILSVSIVVLTGLISCAPRGESKSLSEIFENSKRRFESVQMSGLDDSSSQSLRDLSSLLASLESSSGDLASVSNRVAGNLNSLILKAGYTTRPALGEIILQYRLIGEKQRKSEVSEAHVKLLLARTYRLLAQELETTRFQI